MKDRMADNLAGKDLKSWFAVGLAAVGLGPKNLTPTNTDINNALLNQKNSAVVVSPTLTPEFSAKREIVDAGIIPVVIQNIDNPRTESSLTVKDLGIKTNAINTVLNSSNFISAVVAKPDNWRIIVKPESKGQTPQAAEAGVNTYFLELAKDVTDENGVVNQKNAVLEIKIDVNGAPIEANYLAIGNITDRLAENFNGFDSIPKASNTRFLVANDKQNLLVNVNGKNVAILITGLLGRAIQEGNYANATIMLSSQFQDQITPDTKFSIQLDPNGSPNQLSTPDPNSKGGLAVYLIEGDVVMGNEVMEPSTNPDISNSARRLTPDELKTNNMTDGIEFEINGHNITIQTDIVDPATGVKLSFGSLDKNNLEQTLNKMHNNISGDIVVNLRNISEWKQSEHTFLVSNDKINGVMKPIEVYEAIYDKNNAENVTFNIYIASNQLTIRNVVTIGGDARKAYISETIMVALTKLVTKPGGSIRAIIGNDIDSKVIPYPYFLNVDFGKKPANKW